MQAHRMKRVIVIRMIVSKCVYARSVYLVSNVDCILHTVYL